MKIICRFGCLIVLLLFNAQAAFAGFVNTMFHPGDNLFGNPLDAGNNLLSAIIPTAPEGSMVSLWNSGGNTYGSVATFTAGAWDIDFVLNPGTGAKLHATSSFINTFVGAVLLPNGNQWNGESFDPPPPFAGPNGLYLLSCKSPVALEENAHPAFELVLGRGPNEGEQFTTLDPVTQQYHTTTFIAGAWDNGGPVLSVGAAAFFNVGPVAPIPEPSVAGLIIVGAWLARAVNRRR